MPELTPFDLFKIPGIAVFGGLIDLPDELEDVLLGQLDRGFRTDIKEEENEYIIEAELPGFQKENIEVTVDDDVLKIRAVRDEITEEEAEKYINKERISGEFVREFCLPDMDSDKVTAKYENGVLKVKIAKQSPPRNEKKIEIE